MKQSRGGPCPCGSGRKYKRCCGATEIPSGNRSAEPKGQHFVPRLHLQHFEGDKPTGHVWTYPKKGGVPRSARADGTAKQTHFYSYRDETGVINNSVEDVLALCESEAAPTYERLLNFDVPARGTVERANFAMLLALQYTRTPASRRRGAEMLGNMIQIHNYAHAVHDGAFETITKDFEEARGVSLSDKQRSELRNFLLDPSKITVEILLEKTLPMALGAADKLAPLLHDMEWSVFMPHSDCYFITSDEPVMKRCRSDSYHPFYGDFGFINKTAEVTLALSPRRILILSWDGNRAPLGTVSPTWVDSTNRARAAFADANVYADRLDDGLRAMVAESPDGGIKFKLSGFGPKEFAPVSMVRKYQD